jgi:chloride channel 7
MCASNRLQTDQPDPRGGIAQKLDLRPYTNTSAVSIQSTFSVLRTYILFRTLGLRHLTVVDELNRVVGMVTRKNLLGYALDKKLGTD